jgi:hypothetical protein
MNVEGNGSEIIAKWVKGLWGRVGQFGVGGLMKMEYAMLSEGLPNGEMF